MAQATVTYTTSDGSKITKVFLADGGILTFVTYVNYLTGRENNEARYQQWEGDDQKRISLRAAKELQK